MIRLKIIQIIKMLFLKEFEFGYEMIIPDLLRQDDLPLSFRYYDPIVVFISERLSNDSK